MNARVAAILVTMVSLTPARARGDQTDVCIDANAEVQRLRKAKKLRDARAAALECARDVCPPIVRKECAAWKAELDAAIPLIRVSAFEPGGAPITEARVFLDDQLALARLDGAPLEADPGSHTVRIERAGEAPLTQTVQVKEGDTEVRIVFQFASPPQPHAALPVATAPPEIAPIATRPVPASVYVLSGVSAAGLATFAVTGLIGKSRYDRLRDECPACSDADRSSAKSMLRIADISLAIGVIASGATAWIFFTRPTVTVQSTPHGAMALFQGQF